LQALIKGLPRLKRTGNKLHLRQPSFLTSDRSIRIRSDE